MAQDDRPDGGGQEDSRYFGPFGPPAGSSESGDPQHTAPLGIGNWSYGEETAYGPGPGGSSPYAPGSTASSAPWGASPYPAPSGVPALGSRPAEQLGSSSPPPTGRRPARGASLIALAALVALVVGSLAGYAGSRLGERPAAAPQASTAPTAPPSASASPSAPVPPFTPGPGQPNLVEVSRTALPSTVMIQVGSGTGGGTGSGFVLDARGHVMTNNHVVAGAADGDRIRVVFADGSRASATLVGRSPSYDLAVIRLAAASSAQLRPMRIGDSDASRVGEPVIAIGSPLALPGTVTAGIVSAKDRPVVVNESADADSPSAYINAIQTDAPINPGNSGGPLIDTQARVIGVNSAILTLGQSSGQSGSIGLGFAIPINQAMEIGKLLIDKGKATYPVIGANVSVDPAGEGVRLTTVEAGGPAADAGLRSGDLITKIDGEEVSDIQSLIVTIRTHRPGERVELSYERGGASEIATVTLGSKEG